MGIFIITTNPDQVVLGFFSASSVKSRRIFISPVENLELDFRLFVHQILLEFGFNEIDPSEYPAFLMGDKNGWYGISQQILRGLHDLGGTNIKPDFWPY